MRTIKSIAVAILLTIKATITCYAQVNQETVRTPHGEIIQSSGD